MIKYLAILATVSSVLSCASVTKEEPITYKTTNYVEVKVGQLKLMAKDAHVVGGLKTKRHVDFRGREGSVTWVVDNSGSDGRYRIEFLYALNDLKKSRDMELYVNGAKVTHVAFNNTGSWHHNWDKAEVSVSLHSGVNRIKLQSKGNSAPNLMALLVSG